MGVHVAPVVDSGERVGVGQGYAVVEHLMELVVIAPAPNLSAGARQQLVLVDRPDQVVGDAQIQTLGQLRQVGLVQDQQDRNVPCLVLGPELGAQAQTVLAGQAQADHNQVQPGLPAKLERLGGVGGAPNPVTGVGQEFGQLSGEHVLALDHQDLAVGGVFLGVPRHLAGDVYFAGGRVAHAQLVHHDLEPRERTHPREQGDVVDRLGQEVVGARLEAAHPIGGIGQGRDHDDGDVPRLRVRPEPLGDLETVHARHHDVEQNEIRRLGVGHFEGGGPVARGKHLEVLGHQLGLE